MKIVHRTGDVGMPVGRESAGVGRKRNGRSRRRYFVIVFVVAMAFGATVKAFFTSSGGGSVGASVATLAEATNTTVVSTNANVSVTWTAPASPAGGTTDLKYYVQRYLGVVPSNACGTAVGVPASYLTTTACTDTLVPGGTYTYRVTAVFRSWSTPGAASNSVTVVPVDHFVVAAPATAITGVPLSVTVTAKDAANATITDYVGTVHFTSSDGAAVLPTDYTFVAGDHGVRTFTNAVTFNTAGSLSVSVNDTVQTAAVGAAAVSVTGPAAKLAFSVPPSNVVAGVAVAPAVVVQVQDVFGNLVTSSSASVTVAIGSNPGGGVLSGTVTQAASAGVVTFTNLSINKSGLGYTLTASSSGLTGATSATFNVAAAAASKVAFSVPPSNAVAGVAFAPAVVVQVQDVFGNVVTSSSASVTVAIGSNPGAGTLSGTATQAASAGVATFSNLSINKSGVGYTLAASSSGLTSATSSAFDVTAAAASQLSFTVQPTNTPRNTNISPAVKVQALDQFGNLASAQVTIVLGTAPNNASLAGGSAVATVNGVATFASLQVSRPGSNTFGVTLVAQSGALSITSNSINISA